MTRVVRVGMAMVCLMCGCADVQSSPSRSAASPQAARAPEAGERSISTKRVRSEQPARAQAVTLSATNEAGVDHQIQMLRKSIALYEQFIERAAGQPEMKEAVQRSRERIRDAEETIRFLLQGASAAP
jgi:hypothetical protein